MVSLVKYQHWVSAGYKNSADPFKEQLFEAALGVGGEAGEVQDVIKKGIKQGGLRKNALKEEMGDVIWYLALLCELTGIELEDVFKQNVAKLHERYGVPKIDLRYDAT